MKLADRTTRIAGSPTMKVTATVDRLLHHAHVLTALTVTGSRRQPREAE